MTMTCDTHNYIDKDDLLATINALTVDGYFSERDANYLINFIIAQGKIDPDKKRDLIQIRRGLKANLPILAEGEMAFCYDTEELYIGSKNGNVLISKGDGSGAEIRLLSERFYWSEGRPLVGNFKTVKQDREYNGFPCMVKTPNGRLIVAYSSGKQHKLGSDLDRRVKYKYSDNGGTLWSEEFVMFDTPQRDQFLSGFGVAPNGDVVAFLRSNAINNTNSRNHVLVSKNAGVTFSQTQILNESTVPLVNRSSVPSLMTSMDNGEMVALTTAYFEGRYGLQAIFSTDNGSQWTRAVQIIEPFSVDTHDIPTETRTVYLGNGVLLSIGRSRFTNQYHLISTDYGNTWKVSISNINDCYENPVGVVYHAPTQTIGAYYFDRRSNEFKTRVISRERAIIDAKGWSESRIVTTTGSYRQTIDIGYTTTQLLDSTTLDTVSAIYTSRDIRADDDTTPKRTGIVVIFDKMDINQLYPKPSGKGLNAVDNGDFNINTVSNTAITTTANSRLVVADRWFFTSPAVAEIEVVNNNLQNGRKSLKMTVANATGTTYLTQRIENARMFMGQWVTLTYSARCDKDEFGLNSYIRRVTNVEAINTSNVQNKITRDWGEYDSQFFLPYLQDFNSDANNYIEIQLAIPANSGLVEVEIANVRLTAGRGRTPFYPEHEAEMLARVQRYRTVLSSAGGYNIIGNGIATSETTALIHVPLPTPMRALPSVNPEFASNWSVYTATASYPTSNVIIKPSYISNTSVGLEVTIPAPSLTVGQAVLFGQNGGNRKMIFNAEL